MAQHVMQASTINMTNTFTGMPRMQKLFREVIGDAEKHGTESSERGRGHHPKERFKVDKYIGCISKNRDQP